MLCQHGDELTAGLGNNDADLVAGGLAGRSLGKNPRKLSELDERGYCPFRARLRRASREQKGCQERVKRSQRRDDEEGYLPSLGQVKTEEAFLALGQAWRYYDKVHRPHVGVEMGGMAPLQKLWALGLALSAEFATQR